MKCLVVMSSLPDIVFFWADEAFTEHLNQRASSAGFIGENHNDSTVDINAALQYFSPLVASQRYMNDVNNPYCSITCCDGMIIVVDQKDDFVYLVLNGDGEESEEFLKKKLRFFKNLTSFHFGPCTDRLKPDLLKARRELWDSLSNILKTFCFLCTQEQSFLVEANEMIQVNQFLSEMGIHLLEKVIRTARKEGDPQAKHAMLLVNSKVLALYSSNQASKLQAPDIMMLTTLVRSKFPHPEQTIPLSLNRTPSPLTYKTIQFENVHIKPSAESNEPKNIDHNNLGSKIPYGEVRSTNLDIVTSCEETGPSELYYPACSTLNEGNVDGQSSENSDQYAKENASSSSVTSEKYYTPDDEELSTYFQDDSGSSTSGTKSSKSSREMESNDNELYRQRIFLRPLPSICIPHTVHCLQICLGTVLVIVSEVKKGELARDMCSLIANLSDFLDEKPTAWETVNVVSVVEKVDAQVRKICDGLKGNTASEKTLEVYLNDIRQKWEMVKINDFQGYVRNRLKDLKERLSPKLERALVEMVKSLTKLFGAVYCSGKVSISIHHAKALNGIQETVQKELEDCMGFLTVKAERNVTMTTYLEEFPGLVHFIYIDRCANRVTAPSINTNPQKVCNWRDPAHFIKQSIWDGWNYIQTFVVQGHRNVYVRYGDFLFTYVLWFEDSSGNQRTIIDPRAFVKEFPEPPGIIGSNFYSELKRRCFPSLTQDKIYCYELFCMYLGILPLSQAAGHSRRLAAQLWEASGEANLPMFLVG